MAMSKNSADVIVVGGGLAGLTAAAFAAKAGKSVILCERARDVGGRGVTQNEGGFLFNLGPHALYRSGHAAPMLKELGVRYVGHAPSVSGAYALDGGRKHALPGGFLSLITTSLLRLPAKLELARVLGGLGKIDPSKHQHETVNQWLQSQFRNDGVRNLLRALVRVSSYANAPEVHSAGAAIEQLQGAFGGGVVYIDGGWQTLIEGLRQAAIAAGVEIRSGARVEAVDVDTAVRGVRLAGGEALSATAVVLTGSPSDVSEVVRDGGHLPLRRWVEETVPIRAACLDVGLSRLPQPHATFGLGIDRPLYLSVHSAVAKLGPENSATIHVAKYLAPDDDAPAAEIQSELEQALDVIQPGWREVVVQRRFLPKLIVAHHTPLASAGGKPGRPPVEVPGIANLYLAGDWVGPEGMLADASMASGKQAARLAVAARALSAAA